MAEGRGRAGIIGLGQMGGAMARRLHGCGWDVVGWDLDPSVVASAERDGIRPAADPAQVGRLASIVLTSLPDAAAVRAVALGPSGLHEAGRAGVLLVDTSTVAPDEARLLAADLATRGIELVDAPVTGGPAGASTGTLGIMVGGDDGPIARALPLLEALGTVVRCGPVGSGQVVKACNQLIVVATLGAVAEALALARAAGVDPAAARTALMAGYAASPILDRQGDRMLRRDFTPGGKARFNLKDAATLAALSESTGVGVPVFEAAAGYIRALVDAGGGDLDHSAVITIVERRDAAPEAGA